MNVWRTFPFSAIVLLAGFTSVPTEVLDAARVDGSSFFQRFRHVVVPMIFPILMIGFLFDTVFTLSDLSVVYLLTQGGPANATKILPVLAYQIGIQAGSLGRGAAIALFLLPLLLPRDVPDAPKPQAEGVLGAWPPPRTHRQKEIRRHLLDLRGR